MTTVTYVSNAIHLLTTTELFKLLHTCRTNNATHGLTGMLLYKDGNFMQLLEGEDKPVRDTYRKIAADRRHFGLVKVLEHPIAHRQFPDWAMAFINLDSPDAQAVPGYAEFRDLPLTDKLFQNEPIQAQKLLYVFRDTL